MYADRDHDGYDIVLPAALAEPHWAAWAMRWSSGFLFAPLAADVAASLDLPLVTRGSVGRRRHAVSVDAAVGITTGISTSDRSRTARTLADPGSTLADLAHPGHLVPVVASTAGVIENPTRVEAAVDLCRLAGLPPVALCGRLLRGDGDLVRRPYVADLGGRHEPPIVDVAEIVTHRLFVGDGVRSRVTRGRATPRHALRGALEVVGFIDEVTGAEHIVLRGPGASERPLVSVHVECALGDIFGSDSCPCGNALAEATARIEADGGLLVYLRRPHGRQTAIPAVHTWTQADDGALAAVLRSFDATAIRLLDGPANLERLRLAGIAAVSVT
ncbi:3,4-dihydroxy-2-butanone-4-phosphate synthase [Nocardia salmonicida]|uniref:3,4-dihydroxy-2-butanone-4-phosphate synthase n=1 Tax=Nocardia salmonicida TaxID=53431 RepID=A0ABZ1N3C3_9NOCA